MDNKKDESKSKRKTRTIRGEELESLIASDELSVREECQRTIAGYIRLMQANDKPVFINTKFIVSVEPEKIARYQYTKGSLITLSVGGSEGLQTIKVIETCDVVLQAIEQTREINTDK